MGGHGTGKIITPPRLLDKEATVASIMDGENHSWRLDLISEVFFPVDVDRINYIPLCSFKVVDERVWTASDDGIFRVKDAYSLALSSSSNASSSNGFDPLWKKMWSLNIPPKPKLFLWRAAWDILPHGVNLREKRH